MSDKFFPTFLLILQIAAAAVYYTKGDVRKIIYWLAAATLTIVITY